MRPAMLLPLLAIASLASAQVLEVPVDPTDTNGIGPLGEPFTPYGGMTFVAPNVKATELTFFMRTGTSSGAVDDAEFRVLITEIDGGPSGISPANVLFESSTINLPQVFDGPYEEVTVDLGEVLLTAGETYAWIIDSWVEFDGAAGTGRIALADEDYLDGVLIFLNATSGTRQDHFAATWSQLTLDAAFTMTFEPVPEPGTAVTLGAGLALLAGGVRRPSTRTRR